MLKALYLYSDKTGLKRPKKFQDKIISRLSKSFELVAKKTSTIDEFILECQNCKSNFDVLIVAGGDGTFNLTISTLAKLDKSNRPILGYIPTGTINDAGRGFGVYRVRKALKVLEKQETIDIDICRANDSYFSYVCAIGTYADISYITKRDKKKLFGRLSYYFIAIKEAMKIRNIEAHIVADGISYDVKTPFVLVMNGPSVGGFKINSKSAMCDGLIDIYLTKPGIFNGLLHFIFFKIRTTHIQAKNIEISTNSNDSWCFDGEKGISGDLKISLLNEKITVFGRKNSVKVK